MVNVTPTFRKFAKPQSKQFIEHLQFRNRQKKMLVDVTNYYWPSENFSANTFPSLTAVQNQPSLFGLNTAVLLTDNDAANAGYMQRSSLPVNADTNIYCFSMLVKAVTGNAIQFRIVFGTTSLFKFDFNAKTIVLTSGTNGVAGSYKELGNGWFRIWFYMTNTSQTSITSFRNYPTDGVVTSLGSVYFDKYQLEIVPSTSTPPGPYLTAGSAATSDKVKPN